MRRKLTYAPDLLVTVRTAELRIAEAEAELAVWELERLRENDRQGAASEAVLRQAACSAAIAEQRVIIAACMLELAKTGKAEL